MTDHELRTIEIRRHAERHKPGDNLNARGVARARNASARGRSFARVVTSPIPRAVQTAVAMGHSVDADNWVLASMGERVSQALNFEDDFAVMQNTIRTDRAAGLYAELQALEMRHDLFRVEPGEAVLVVSHGGIAEAGIIGLLDGVDVAAFGPSLDYCEGARLEFAGGRCRRVQLLRFDGEREHESLTLDL
jgi:broad specificity phosphatase PhoE